MRRWRRALDVRAVTSRVMWQVQDRLGPDLRGSAFLLESDVSSPTGGPATPGTRPARGTPLRIAWISTPPGLGSGGHTTMFRMVEALERAGHSCTVLLYDPYDGDSASRAALVRQGWPDVRAEVRSVRAGIAGYDAVIATSWQTAHALAQHQQLPTRRLYFVQDYEPWFYPRGSEYALAKETFGFGFRHIALGEMVAACLRTEAGATCDVVPFGCDSTTYHLPASPRPRAGVVFYAKPGTSRRGYLLSRMALQLFHERYPEEPIHAYGQDSPGQLSFPVTWHGRLTPPDLNDLYGSAVAGLAMSFTNVSLIAEEMLAAGCVPVINDDPLVRADLDNAEVLWTRPTPQALADALCRAVDAPDVEERATRAAAGVRQGWGTSQNALVQIVEDEVYG